MVQWLQTILGLTHTEAQFVAAIIGAVAGLFTILGTGTAVITYRLGKIRGWRDYHREIDRGNVVEVDLIIDDGDVRAQFEITTVRGILPLDNVLLDRKLENVAQGSVGAGPGFDWLFPEGESHHRAYERAIAHVNGNEWIANQSVLFGRRREYHTDMTAVALLRAVAEDGRRMAHIVKANPRELERLVTEETYYAKLKPFRGVHVPYRDLSQALAREFARSKELFAEVARRREDVPEAEWAELERQAGEKAHVWLTPMRTQKTGATPEEVRSIVREEIETVLSKFLQKQRAGA